MKPANLLILFALLLPGVASSTDIPPRIVVTIKPIHSIVSAIMKDIYEPELLLDGFASPHTYHLKPSDAQLISNANVMIWIGPSLETLFTKVIRQQQRLSMNIQLVDTDNDHAQSHHETDPHIWLDPQQALKVVNTISRAMVILLPEETGTIQKNTVQLIAKIKQLDQSIAEQFKAHPMISAVTYHRAWDYFENRYGLTTQGVISVHMQQQPSANHLYKLQQRIQQQNIQCLLIEPQFKPKYINALAGDHPLRLVEADPLGANIKPGPDAYFEIMRQISNAFYQCRKN